jgi:hypothetical protein
VNEIGADLKDPVCQFQCARLMLRLREKPDLKRVFELLTSAAQGGVTEAATLLKGFTARAPAVAPEPRELPRALDEDDMEAAFGDGAFGGDDFLLPDIDPDMPI